MRFDSSVLCPNDGWNHSRVFIPIFQSEGFYYCKALKYIWNICQIAVFHILDVKYCGQWFFWDSHRLATFELCFDRLDVVP